MFVLYGEEGRTVLADLKVSGGIKINNQRIQNGVGNSGVTLAREDNLDLLQARFNDIVAALASGKVGVYDTSEEVGYWKPKATPKKAAAKAPAKAPEGK